MLYTDFGKTLESRLGTHADLYPHAAKYHRVRFEQTIHHLLNSILIQTEALMQKSDVSWTHSRDCQRHSLLSGNGRRAALRT